MKSALKALSLFQTTESKTRGSPKGSNLGTCFISVLKYLISLYTATSFKIIFFLGEKMLEENGIRV